MTEDEYERDLTRRLHAAAIARGKAEAELERTPREGPSAFRLRALTRVAQAQVTWLRIYFEGVLHFQDAIADTHPEDGDVQQAPLVSGGGARSAIARRNP